MSWRSMLLAMAVVEADPSLGDDGVATEITEEDAAEIRVVVRAQMAAFRAGDAARAWSLASEAIHETFGTADRLMAAVRERFTPLAMPKQVFFDELSLMPDGLGQSLHVIDADGDTHHLLFLVVQDDDAEWRVNGCLLVAPQQSALAA